MNGMNIDELVDAIEIRLKPYFDQLHDRISQVIDRLDRIEQRLEDVVKADKP